MNSNELRLISHILSSLRSRIYKLRNSVEVGKNPVSVEELFSKYISSEKNDKNEKIVDPFDEDKRFIIQCREIEDVIEKLLYEISERKTVDELKRIIQEYAQDNVFVKEQQKCLIKKNEIDELKENLSRRESIDKKERAALEEDVTQLESAEKLSHLEELMKFRLDSKKQYYDFLFGQTAEKIAWYKRQTIIQEHADIQTVSFWLLKYKENCKELDLLFRQTFDNWMSKEREIAILKKYRKLNLKKIDIVLKQIAYKKKVIEDYEKKREIEKEKQLEEARRTKAAIQIQAFWRGTMVRKHLGPYKIKKKKKGKKGKKSKRK